MYETYKGKEFSGVGDCRPQVFTSATDFIVTGG